MKDRRHQIEERETILTSSQKEAIAEKSDQRCCWCGKKVYFGYGATVDHYIPLKKGGTNDFSNLVMMCESCNKKKGSKIIPINIAANYLKESVKDEIGENLDNFVHSYEYLSRGNLMGYDMYELVLSTEEADSAIKKIAKKKKSKNKKSSYDIQRKLYTSCVLKRAYPEDEDKVVEYYIKYLKKYDRLDSRDAARANVKFWMRFGAIYYVEKNGEVTNMGTFSVNKHNFVNINLFSRYATDSACAYTIGIVNCLCEAIMTERNLPYLPIAVCMLRNDPLSERILSVKSANRVDNASLICTPYVNYNYSFIPTEEDKDGTEALKKFLHYFNDVEGEINIYLYENDLMECSWIADEILGREVFA